MVAWRCSPTPWASIPRRCSSGISRSRSARAVSSSARAGGAATGSGLRRNRYPPPTGAPTTFSGSCSATAALIRISPASALDSHSKVAETSGPVRRSSRWTPRGRKTGKAAAVHPDGDAEPHRSPVALLYRFGDEGTHAVRSSACTDRIVLTREQDEQRVPTELDDVAALPVADADHGVEARVEQVGQLFGTPSAHGRELLGQAREPRDVGGHERPGDQARRLVLDGLRSTLPPGGARTGRSAPGSASEGRLGWHRQCDPLPSLTAASTPVISA